MNEPAQGIQSVPLLDLKRQFPEIRDAVLEAITAVSDSQQFVLGPEVEALESEIADYCGTRHGVGVSSGTDALLVALMALGVGPGDAVMTSPYSFFATAGVIARLGAKPVFADIDPVSFNLSSKTVQAAIEAQCEARDGGLHVRGSGERVRVLMPVHLYGQMVEMGPIREVARRYGLRVVEDAAQAIGAKDSAGVQVGEAGDIACLSFFPSKNLGGFGDGGMCVTNDPQLSEDLRVLRVHGGKPKYHHERIGGNFRLDAIQAAVLRVKLRHLDDWSRQRQENAEWYDARLSTCDHITCPRAIVGARHVYNQYVVRVPERDAVRAHLQSAGIGTEIYYPIPLHLQGCFKDLGYQAGSLPESESAARDSLALPVFPGLTRYEMAYIGDAVVAATIGHAR
jgi:dTDP-4-amino-4,6-dideoxygalactose transaminase